MLKASWLSIVSFTLLTAAAETSAHAQETGFALNRLEPAERGSTWFVLDSLDLRGSGRPALGVTGDYQYRPLAVYDPSGEVRSTIVGHVMTTHVGGSVVLADRVRIGANMPLVLYQDGEPGSLRGRAIRPPQAEQAVGDLRVAADIRLFGDEDAPIALAVGARVWIPTGDPQSYTSDGRARVAPHWLVAGDVGPVVYAGRIGALIRDPQSATFAGSPISHELVYAASVGASLADDRLTIGPEIYGSTTFAEETFKTRTSPLEGILGAHYAFENGLRIGGGAGSGLTRGYGSPQLRLLLAIEWMPELIVDEDKDGIPDEEDACVHVPGLRSTDPRRNGCPPPPPPPDRDGDGIIDREDACPEVFGQRTGDVRTNGCADRDGDGVFDPVDQCPALAGLPSEDPQWNGCPDPDPDKDGVLGKDDQCPNVPGVRSTDPKLNGCPDPDRDKDGIPNDSDACPDEPGKASPDPKKNGCPIAVISQGLIKIAEQVKFKTMSAEIVPGRDSEEILDAVAKILKDHPEIKRVRVEGFTDDRGPAFLNTKLSKDRAAAVVQWLVKNGIDKARLTSDGFGPERPIDVNTTEAGRTNNRRVEFHIVDPADGGAKP